MTTYHVPAFNAATISLDLIPRPPYCRVAYDPVSISHAVPHIVVSTVIRTPAFRYSTDLNRQGS
jgi:hypothetical protein